MARVDDCATPALLTRMVTVPKAFSAASKARAMAARSVTSASIATARPPAASISTFASAASRSARRATSATAAPLSASARANCWPSPLEAPVTSATRPCRSEHSAAFIVASCTACVVPLYGPIKRMRQRGRKPRHEPQHDQRAELDQHERDDADIDMPRGDLGRRHAAQIEQRRPERRMHVGGLQVHRHHDAEPDRIDAGHRQQRRRHDRHHHEDDLEGVHHEAEQEHRQHHRQHRAGRRRPADWRARDAPCRRRRARGTPG